MEQINTEVITGANVEVEVVDRVTQTIDRLISNLPEAVIRLKRIDSTSLARQIQNDLDNLVYWQKHGGLMERKPDQCDCDQINWVKGPHHQEDCPMFEEVRTNPGVERKKDEVTERPTIVCLCGSTRFSQEFQDANLAMTLNGYIVLTVGCDTKSDDDLFSRKSPEAKAKLKNELDILHFRKIDLADGVLILNVGGYIGESTSRELAYAKALGKQIWFLEAEADDENLS